MICNSTPIICLAKIGGLELLRRLFTIVTIPEAVKEELLVEGKVGQTVIAEAIKAGWLRIANPKKNIELGLGKGENSAINLVKETGDKLIIDDALAIKAAKTLNLEVTRTTTVVFMAVEKKIISKKQAISIVDKLISGGYYISPKYITAILTRLNT